MNLSSVYKIKIDFLKSKNSYLFDKMTKKFYLDFFGQYSTLSIGYNNSIFRSKEYLNEIKKLSHQKITNCEILSDEAINFNKEFKEFVSLNKYSFFHYCCTGALAIEAAIKTAIDYKKPQKGFKVVAFKGSFHGINGYGGIITDRFEGVNKRLEGFPGNYWDTIDPYLLEDLEKDLKKKNITAIIVEPVQCTFGDRYLRKNFFFKIRRLSNKYDVPLIFDEVQTGFCTTGKVWYFQHLGILPDIVVFGKKTQVSGIMVKKKFSKIFQNSIRLEVTWDSDIMDMTRALYIIKVLKKNKKKKLKTILVNSKRIINFLKKKKNLFNVRGIGYLIAFDLIDAEQRNRLWKLFFKNGLLCNKTRDKTIRFRPNLLLSNNEIDHFEKIINTSLNEFHLWISTLKKKIVFITGGTKGIGKQLVKDFIKLGAQVYTTSSSIKKKRNKRNLHYKYLNLLDSNSIKKFKQDINHIKKVDILVNNAGINKIDSIEKIKEKDWDDINNVNLKGPFLMTQIFFNKLKRSKNAKIVNMSSIFSIVSKKKRVVYSSTKSGILGLTRASALDLSKYNILVNAVSPGFVETSLTRRILGTNGIKNIKKKIPLNRLATVRDISNLVIFLCSDYNNYINGQNIVIDGGYLAE